jgi:hypothetical protein
MKLLALLAADYANVERGGKLNVMGIFNDINAAQFPTRHSAMHLVAKLGADLGESAQTRQLTIKLLDEDGVEMLKLSQDFQLPESSGGRRPEFNFVVELRDLVFPKPGRYEFVLLVDSFHAGDIPVYVNQIIPVEE